MTEYLAGHPELTQQLKRALQDVRARGYEVVPMDRVKQPFDYPPQRRCEKAISVELRVPAPTHRRTARQGYGPTPPLRTKQPSAFRG